MTVLTNVDQQIRPLQGAVTRDFDAGGAGNVGDLVYIASDGDVEVADGSASATAEAVGIVVGTSTGQTAFAAGDGVTVVVLGPVAGFSGMTPGASGYVSDTAGAIDDAAGTVTWVVGYSESATVFFVQPGMALATS